MEVKNKREDLFTKTLPPIVGESGSDGITYDVLWEGNIIPDGQVKPIELTHDLDEYKFIIACQVRGTNVGSAASILPVEFMTKQSFYPIFLYVYSGSAVEIDSFAFAEYTTGNTNYAVYKPTGEGANAIYGVNIIGIK